MSWLRLFTSLSLLNIAENSTTPLDDALPDIMSNSTEINQQYFKYVLRMKAYQHHQACP